MHFFYYDGRVGYYHRSHYRNRGIDTQKRGWKRFKGGYKIPINVHMNDLYKEIAFEFDQLYIDILKDTNKNNELNIVSEIWQ